jgi:hypothetical protein
MEVVPNTRSLLLAVVGKYPEVDILKQVLPYVDMYVA